MSVPLYLKVKAVKPGASQDGTEVLPQFQLGEHEIGFQDKAYKFSGILHDELLSVWDKMVSSPAVLVLLGPSGSGKTTTMKAVLSHKLAQNSCAYFSVCEVSENRSFVDLLDNNSTKRYLSTMPLDRQLKKFKFSEQMVSKMLAQRKKAPTLSNANSSRSCLIVTIYEANNNVFTVVDMMGSEKFDASSSNSFANSNVSSLTHQLLAGAVNTRSSNLVTNLIFHKLTLAKVKFILHLDLYGNEDLIKSSLCNIVNAVNGFKIEARKAAVVHTFGDLPGYARPTLASSSPKKKYASRYRVNKPAIREQRPDQRLDSAGSVRKHSKLDQLREDLLMKENEIQRLMGSVQEKESEIETLQDQVRVKDNDADLLKEAFAVRLEEVEAETQLKLDSVEDKLAASQNLVANLKDELISQREELSGKLADEATQSKMLQESLRAREEELAAKAREIDSLRMDLTSLQSNLNLATESIKTRGDEILQLKEIIEQKDDELKRVNAELNEARANVSSRDETVNELQRKQTQSNEEIESLKQKLQSVNEQLEDSKREVESLITKSSQLSEEASKNSELATQLEAEIAKSRQTEETTKQLSLTLEQQATALKDVEGKLKEANETHQKLAAERDATIDKLKFDLKESQEFYLAKTRELQQKSSELEALKAQHDQMEQAVTNSKASEGEIKKLEEKLAEQEKVVEEVDNLRIRCEKLETSAREAEEVSRQKEMEYEANVAKLNGEIHSLKAGINTETYGISSENFGSDLATDLSESLGGDLTEHTFGYNPMDFAGVTSTFSPSEIFQDNPHRDYMKMAKKSVKHSLNKTTALRDTSNALAVLDKKKLKRRSSGTFSGTKSPKVTRVAP